MASPLRYLVGRKVKFRYMSAATSCCSSGPVTITGTVTGIRHNPTPHFGRDTLLVANANLAREAELTHVQDSAGRWHKFEPRKAKA